MNSDIIKDAKILVIDDQPANLSILFIYLDRLGVKVLMAQNGYKGIELAKKEKPDIIILDIMMPEMDGYQVCSELKSNEDTKDIPLIFMSALGETSNIVKGFETGGVDYIVKPVHQEELVSRITTHLKIRKAEKEILYRLELEGLLSRISSRFVNVKDGEFDNEVHLGLKIIGEFSGVDRVSILLFSSEMVVEKTYKFDRDNTSQAIPELKGKSFIEYKWFIEKIKKAEIINFSNIKDIPSNALMEREFVKDRGILSALLIPLFFQNKFLGIFQLVNTKTEKIWKEEDIKLIKLLSELFVNLFEHKRIDEELSQAKKLESLGIMSGGIAHEFNNILANILCSAELCLMDVADNSPMERHIQSIINSTNRASNITRQILFYLGHGNFVMENINLSDLIVKMKDLIKFNISHNSILELELSDDLPVIKGDISQISQVIINLITNSSEAIGDKVGVITISTGIAHGYKGTLSLYLDVKDNGCGMTKEVMSKIFDPFFSTKFPGRGLGLPVSYGIMKKHGGAINILSETDKGTTVRLSFPIKSDT